jgi:hypothetical protein
VWVTVDDEVVVDAPSPKVQAYDTTFDEKPDDWATNATVSLSGDALIDKDAFGLPLALTGRVPATMRPITTAAAVAPRSILRNPTRMRASSSGSFARSQHAGRRITRAS